MVSPLPGSKPLTAPEESSAPTRSPRPPLADAGLAPGAAHQAPPAPGSLPRTFRAKGITRHVTSDVWPLSLRAFLRFIRAAERVGYTRFVTE